MAYVPEWEQLAEALERVIASGGLSTQEAQCDICRAIANQKIKVRPASTSLSARSPTISCNTSLLPNIAIMSVSFLIEQFHSICRHGSSRRTWTGTNRVSNTIWFSSLE